MDLARLIKELEALPDGEIIHGFGEPMSYRGYYDKLAFEPTNHTTVGQMLAHARSAMGATFTGYKGGEYTMGEWSDCYIARYGQASEGSTLIGETMIALWKMQVEPATTVKGGSDE